MTDRARKPESTLLFLVRNPLRRKILQAMADGRPRSPAAVARELEEPLCAVTYQFHLLIRRGALAISAGSAG